MASLQPAVRKESNKVLLYVAIGAALTVLAFFLLNIFFPDDIPFDYTVIAGAVCGAFVAWLNFFLMCLTVQKVAADTDDVRARNIMKMSYTYRYLMQIAWIIIAIVVPCFQPVAGIVPLLAPSLGIKINSIFGKKQPASVNSEGDNAEKNNDNVGL